MAAPTRILTLSLGTQTIGLAEFKIGQNGAVVLSSYQARELLADPAADSTRIAQANLLLKELVQSLKLRGARINYAVSSQSVFTRFVKLPSVGEEQVDQIVTFEAQQNVPYPINEVVWDYQLVDSGDPSQVEVVIVAVKADLLDDINDAVETSGLKTTIVDVAPMAVYNAFRYNYSDITGCSLIIDIGSRSTNLIFIEPHKVFSRSIPNGGSAITQAIAKDFGEPFGVAEERKKRDGFVSLGGAYAEPEDPDVARVSKMIRNTMTRLHAEIARSISFYRAQQGGTQPERIFLCGGSTTLPYMREFFTEKLQLPVEFFNPLRNVAVTGNVSAEEISRNAHRLGELVGLALRGTSECPMEMNLRPKKVVRRHELAKRRPFIIVAGIAVLALMAGWWQYFVHATVVITEASEKVAQQSAPLQSLEKKMDAARAAIKDQQNTVAPLLTAVDDRSYWVQIIDDINVRLPKEYVWVTSFAAMSLDKKGAAGNTQGQGPKPKPGGGPGGQGGFGNQGGQGGQRAAGGTILLLKGLYLWNPKQALVVDDFVAKLKTSDLYEVDEKNLKRSVPNETEWAYGFEIPLILKNPIKLSPAELGGQRKMNWIKANKFLAGFFAVMLVGIGVLGYFLFTASSDFDTADDNYHGKAGELSRLRHLALYPNQKNLKALEAQKDEAAELVSAFQAQLTTREFPADEITPQEFQDKLKKDVTDIVEKAAAAHMELPKEKFYLGFDPYETRPPEVDAVGPLSKQLKTIQWVMQKLIEKKISKLVSLKRFPLPEEKGLSGANNRRPERPDRQERGGSKELVSKYPFDLELVARQKSLSDTLDAIAGALGPPFIIPRVVRFTNERTKGPERAGAPGSSTGAPGQAPAPLGYIVGMEMVEVSLRLEMVEFAPPKEKEDGAAKPKASK